MAAPEVDISALSEQQELALQQYLAVTDQDVQAAIPLLQRSQWNVQIAIAKFFDGEGPDPVAEAIAAQNAPPPRTSRQENLQESLLFGNGRPPRRTTSQPIPAPRIVPSQDDIIHRPPLILAIVLAPFGFLYRILFSNNRLFSYLFSFLPQMLRPNPAGTARRANTVGRRALKPRDAAARLRREFEEEYGANTLPWYEGGYAQALDLAKAELKFLLVVLLSPEHDDTSSFIRDTLLAPALQGYLSSEKKDNLILWMGDVRDSEAYQVSTAVNCTKFPYTAVVAHSPQVSSTAMSVIAHVAGPMDANAYLAKIRATISNHESQLEGVRATRNAQNFERNLRVEQDSAYERSLAADRERARLKKEAEARAAEEERKRIDDERLREKIAKGKAQWRTWRAARINPEPSAEDKDTVRLAIKMPEMLDGREFGAERVMRRFRASDSIEEVYAFVDCWHLLGSVANEAEKPSEQDYTHDYQFHFVQPLPRKVFTSSEAGSIGSLFGKGTNLIVEPTVESGEEEE